MPSGVEALLGALPVGLRKGSDTRGYLISVVDDYDPASGRVLAAIGDESAWLLALGEGYMPGDLVAVMRNPWDGKAELVIGTLPTGALSVDPPPNPGGHAEVQVRYDGAVRIITTYLADHPHDAPGGS